MVWFCQLSNRQLVKINQIKVKKLIEKLLELWWGFCGEGKGNGVGWSFIDKFDSWKFIFWCCLMTFWEISLNLKTIFKLLNFHLFCFLFYCESFNFLCFLVSFKSFLPFVSSFWSLFHVPFPSFSCFSRFFRVSFPSTRFLYFVFCFETFVFPSPRLIYSCNWKLSHFSLQDVVLWISMWVQWANKSDTNLRSITNFQQTSTESTINDAN